MRSSRPASSLRRSVALVVFALATSLLRAGLAQSSDAPASGGEAVGAEVAPSDAEPQRPRVILLLRTPGDDDTMARQPRRTPSSAANGMASACPPEKPTTSHGIGLPPVSMVNRAPTDIAWIGPATSTIRPRTAMTRPKISTPSISPICSASAFMSGGFRQRRRQCCPNRKCRRRINHPLGLPPKRFH